MCQRFGYPILIFEIISNYSDYSRYICFSQTLKFKNNMSKELNARHSIAPRENNIRLSSCIFKA